MGSDLGVGQPRRDVLGGAADLHAGFFQQQQDRFFRQLAPPEPARHGVGHIGGDVRQRPLGRAAHPHRFLHRVARRQPQRVPPRPGKR